jgi:hypothetical protein
MIFRTFRARAREGDFPANTRRREGKNHANNHNLLGSNCPKRRLLALAKIYRGNRQDQAPVD